MFLNLRCQQGHATQGREPAAPFQTFHDVDSDLRQIGDAFYIKAAGDYTVMEYGDQYGAIYQPHALRDNATVVVKLQTPICAPTG